MSNCRSGVVTGSFARLCSVGLAAVVAATSISPASAQTLTPINLRVDVFFYGSHVPLLLGIVDGIYKKHGLDVTAFTGRGSATTIQTVANGTDQFGFADGGVLVKFAAQGLKAKQIVGMLQSNPSIIMSLPDRNIKSPKDLMGRTGGFGNGSAPEQIFAAFGKLAKIDISTIKRVGVDIPTRDSLFIQGKIDFSFGYSVTQLPIMQEKCNCKVDVIRYTDVGITAISNGIVTSAALAAEKPEIVRAFAQATAEAIEAAAKDPKKGVDAFFEYAKDTKLSRDVVTNQWAETVKLLKTSATKSKPYGVMDESDWQKTIDLLEEYAEVPKGVVKPQTVFTNEFLKK